ncbi:MAG: hypothetical protein GDA40_05825 [Rhodobacteraceae bacterium]|nr:hypothetical protein [Paracoccaceae bacterium]
MGSKHQRLWLSVVCTATLAASSATAQDQPASTNRVAAKTDWSVFVEDEPKECWGVSQPKETVNTRDGRVVAVRRSEILLFVYYRPEADVKGQVTFTGGYPFARGSSVNLNIGGTEFELITVPEDDPSTPGDDREWAWPATTSDDAKIITAMKRGTQAVLTARSGRGTVTKDTFSLLGFTAVIEDAESRCSAG